MKLLSMILSVVLGQDTEHDPEAMAFCSGKFTIKSSVFELIRPHLWLSKRFQRKKSPSSNYSLDGN